MDGYQAMLRLEGDKEDDVTNHVAGKSIVITGAGGGFGGLASRKAAALGARLTCADIDLGAAEAVAGAIREAGGEAQAVEADVTNIESMRRLAQVAVGAYGVIDVMVNNAGVMPLAYIADHANALEAWSRCIDINFKGVMNGTVAVFDQMMAQGRGHVINLSSIYGNHPVVGGAVYGATKAAVNYFSESLRVEARGRIKVTVVKPTGVMATGLGGTVVNAQAGMGIMGHNVAAFAESLAQMRAGTLPADQQDPESVGYVSLAPEHIADAVVHVINQPWGVSIGDITVRASGDHFIL
jgi:NADP-dependent 3-hydroxy acid dehydrogenase YdfG